MLPKVKVELNKMVSVGIMNKWRSPLHGLIKWQSSLKRICLDPRNYKAIKGAHYPLPTIDEMAANLSGAKFFCTVWILHVVVG